MTLKELALRILDLPEEQQEKKAWFLNNEEMVEEIDNLESAAGHYGESDLEKGDFILTP